MNATLLKALIDMRNQEASKNEYAQKFNALESGYRDAMEKAYGLESADEWKRLGWGGRAENIMTSRILDALGNERVAEGRSEMTSMNPLLVQLLRSQGFKDAFQGAREAEMQLPDENDPRAVLNFFENVRKMGEIPYSPRDKRLQKPVQQQEKQSGSWSSIAEKYGY